MPGPGGGFNTMLATNANLQSQGLAIGTGSSNNTATVQAGTTWNLLGQNATIGSLAATGNVFNVNGLVNNAGAVTVGNGKAGSPNTNSIGNSLVIGNGGTLVAGVIKAGNVAGDNNNAVQVINGGLLEANTLTVLAGSTGNTISNRNATYQFSTATPTITPNGFGNIAISSGTISFLGINNADVTANQSTGALSPIRFAGANTFMLNAASNINASGGAARLHLPSRRGQPVQLREPGHGQRPDRVRQRRPDHRRQRHAAYFQHHRRHRRELREFRHRQRGQRDGEFREHDQQSRAAHVAKRDTQYDGAAAINFTTGTIHGNGTINSDLNNLGTISPVGTLTFNGNLTLFSGSVVVMELTGYGNGVGTNDVIAVGGGGTFEYFGKLVVTNTTGFAFAYGQEFQLFNFGIGNQVGDFSATNLPNLTPFGLAWNTSQLDTSGLLVVVPEPSSMLLGAARRYLLWVCWIQAKRRPVQ